MHSTIHVESIMLTATVDTRSIDRIGNRFLTSSTLLPKKLAEGHVLLARPAVDLTVRGFFTSDFVSPKRIAVHILVPRQYSQKTRNDKPSAKENLGRLNREWESGSFSQRPSQARHSESSLHKP